MLRERISEASGRSVRRSEEMLGKWWYSVKLTIPQPAPSSKTLRFCCIRSFSKTGSLDLEVYEGERFDMVCRYEEKVSPASLRMSC